MRNLMLGALLEKGDLNRFGLLLVVNAREGSPRRAMYEEKLRRLRDAVSIPEGQLALCSWHDLACWAKPMGPKLEIAVEALEKNSLILK
jgi:hypothetical protein